jgi:hypothetical protein
MTEDPKGLQQRSTENHAREEKYTAHFFQVNTQGHISAAGQLQ